MSEFGDSILPMNHRATKWVQGVAERLIDKNGLGHVVTRAVTSKEDQKPEEWLVYVVNQDIKNAFVMPGMIYDATCCTSLIFNQEGRLSCFPECLDKSRMRINWLVFLLMVGHLVAIENLSDPLLQRLHINVGYLRRPL